MLGGCRNPGSRAEASGGWQEGLKGFGGRTGTRRQDQAPFLLVLPVASKALGPGRLPDCPSGKGAARVHVETRPARPAGMKQPHPQNVGCEYRPF